MKDRFSSPDISKTDFAKVINRVENKERALEKDTEAGREASKKLIENLSKTRIVDITVQIIIRIVLTLFFLLILVVQNYYIFKFIDRALQDKSIVNIQPILSVTITGTLTETYFIIREIVKWAMKSIDYDP